MPTYDLKKECELCNKAIPDEYGNLLCDECYPIVIAQQEKADKEVKEQRTAELKKNPESPTNDAKSAPIVPVETPSEPSERPVSDVESKSDKVPVDNRKPSDFGILDEKYKENPEAEDKDQVLANLAQFIYSHDPNKGRTGKLLWYPTRNMYNYIRNYCMNKLREHPQYPKYIWKPNIVDVGCGSGVGSNVLSQEANMVWGIDKNPWSIEFAKEAFTREKNNYYYSTQLTYDVIDILKDNREMMKFDIVVAIEVIEHIYDTELFYTQLINKFNKRDRRGKHLTEYFFSSPNRAFHKLRDDQPENPFHVREWTAKELIDYTRKFFTNVESMNQKGEPVKEDTDKDEIILIKASAPKI